MIPVESWEARGSEDVEEDTLTRCSLLGLSTQWNGDSEEIIPRTGSSQPVGCVILCVTLPKVIESQMHFKLVVGCT
jgi:hypothetical protein